jgi:hypothetical protein
MRAVEQQERVATLRLLCLTTDVNASSCAKPTRIIAPLPSSLPTTALSLRSFPTSPSPSPSSAEPFAPSQFPVRLFS